MRKLATLLSYLVIGIVLLAIYYYREAGEFWDSLRGGSDGPLYVFWFKYLKNADSWNMFFFVIFITSFLVFMTFVDAWLTKIFRFFQRKYSTKNFLAITGKPLFRGMQIFVSCIILFIAVVVLSNVIVIRYGNKHTIDNIKGVNENSVVLILGTNKYLRSDKTRTKENLYFTYRIDAAKELWNESKVREFIVSGDKTGEANYDETKDIKDELLSFGVPESVIKIDTSGLRTHDSMIALRNFCSKLHTREVVIISQKFHTQRALFMAPFFGISAKAYNAKGSPTVAMHVREFFGKPKVIIDLFITNIQPKEQSSVEYRERFEVTSQEHILLVLSVIGAFISTIVFLTKYIDRAHEVKAL